MPLLADLAPSSCSLPSHEKSDDTGRLMGHGVGGKMHPEGLLLETVNLLQNGKHKFKTQFKCTIK